MNDKENLKNGFLKDDSYKNLERVNSWIVNCDTKASVILAFVGVFITVFLTSDIIKNSYSSVIINLETVSLCNFKSNVLFLIVANTLLFSYLFIKAVINLIISLTATVDITQFNDEHLIKDSNIFFVTIATLSYSIFKDNLANLKEEDLINDINSQTYINSQICTKKFKFYNLGLRYVKKGFFSFIFLSILLFLISLL